ncbi:D-alanyl-D-alanine carboxypeptidase family protein [Streptomyces sp. NBC_00059]|uniref:D-alanyl-D-alanine carboxypeptidase family protein n=1 Tax=Streptomyces sp. NBC_00059 TaxID=2975635 RepID=UPI00225BD9E9|nr:serine hydrolase [Streptomyces sp. NBC_00059]MCX5411481.1 serine hydrolase [Streptomyces sp. NBC_00059]
MAGHKARSKRLRNAVVAAVVSGGVMLAVTPLMSSAEAAVPLPTLSAKGAFLQDRATGVKKYGKNADIKRQMASTTKVMTAAVVLNTPGVDLSRKVTISQTYRDYVTAQGASTADLKTGDKATVRQLLHALMLPSGCDAAYALADTYGVGTTRAARTKQFIGQMNAKAASLGMTNTHFDSFDGISSAGNNYSTPRDLAQLASYAMRGSTLRGIMSTTKYVAPVTTSTGALRTYTWYNTNKLLGSYSGAVGIKTGTGTAAGPCLIFAATRGDKTYVGVILNGTDRYNDAAKLLDYGFGSTTATTMKLRTLPPGAQRD